MKHLFDARALLWRGPLLALLVVAGFVASPAHPASAATAALSVGSFHSCALTTAGGLKCWGENSDGRLGDGTTTDRSMPVDVSGLTSGVAAVSAGTNHTCALTAAGAVKCWGENSDGRLGDGTTTDRSTPVAVRGLTIGLVAVSVGSSHACALTKGGAAKCWGGNSYGQLGDGTTADRGTPVTVSELSSQTLVGPPTPRPSGSALPPAAPSGLVAVSAGAGHSCAITLEGSVKCWGDNSHGQLGDGTGGPDVFSAIPVDVKGLASGVATVSAGGSHSCAVTTEGAVKCWGDNSNGQLGDGSGGTDIFSATPVDVTGLASGVAELSTGQRHTCTATTAGVLKCWGSDSTDTGPGLSGNEGANRTVPLDVAGLTSGVAAVSSGDLHTCTLTTGGGVKCWGDNSKGQLGNGTISGGPTPVDVVGFADASSGGATVVLIAGAAAGLLIVLIVGGWFARRRGLLKRA